MMICDADFDDIFETTRKTHTRRAANAPFGQPGARCLARWEDDGGRVPDPRAAVHAAQLAPYGADDPLKAGVDLAMMSAVAAYGATWAMLAGFGRLLEG